MAPPNPLVIGESATRLPLPCPAPALPSSLAAETETVEPSVSGTLQRHLLEVLQDASVAEVVDVAAQVHQLGVDVGGHAAVGGGGEVGAAGHHACAPWWGALSTPLHQGTISAPGRQQEVELVAALLGNVSIKIIFYNFYLNLMFSGLQELKKT